MKKLILTTILIIVIAKLAISQELIQTVRGTVIDIDSKLPLIGASVIVSNGIQLNTVTNAKGDFRFENVPVGRVSVLLTYLGYETKTIPNIEVNSGKEVVLDLTMQESTIKLNEVVIKGNKKKGTALNDMSLLSARSISIDETKRYAGGFDDPSRVVANFAGVTSTPDGSSDIIVRGNSPKYMQWRLEGVEITNPYHFDDQNSAFGGLSALNNNLLAASDFYTGAFSPEYGNVLSNVFDVKLRAGNNEKYECTAGVGLIGTDLTLEGPFKKGYAGSFLVNYRYSTASLVQDMGLINVDGLFNFQDANLKLVLPTKKAGSFSLFAMGGFDSFFMDDIRASMTATPTNRTMTANTKEDYDKGNFLVNSGINHTLSLGKNSYLKTNFSYSGNGISDKIYESKTIIMYNNEGVYLYDSLDRRQLNFDNSYSKSVYRGAIAYNGKINAKNKIQIGAKYSLYNYDFEQSMRNKNDSLFTVVDFKENVTTIQTYISWKYRLNEKITFVSGLHNMNVLLNSKSTLEPRLAFNWQLNSKNSIHTGYGNHSTMENIQHYFAIVQQKDGSVTEPNKDLGLLKAHHFVLGYEKRFTDNLMAKVELYYQYLYNLPVENIDTSCFATINEGINYQYVDLVNEGTGKNYGIEMTIERFFDNNYFFLINASVYNSTYKTLEGVERNTRYNQNYMANILFGKEFHNLGRKNNQTLGLNCKLFFQGERKYIPLLRDGSGNLAVEPENNRYWDYYKAYDKGLDNIYQINISVSYKFNRLKTTHEIFLDLQNLSNSMAKIDEYYDESEPGKVGYLKQFGFFPNLMYRVYF